jgi:3-oxoacyl-[acyl-carrier protein] reductase
VADTALITGASRGIGRACALAFAERGLDLALLGRPSEAQEQARQTASERGVRATSHACDMADAEAVSRAAAEALEAHGPPLVVVSNAGLLHRGPLIHQIDVADWDRVMAVNLRGPFLLCRALLPAMLHAGRGRFIHLGSISSTLGSPHAAAYAASKWGLTGLHKTLTEELRGTGLVSVALLPGSVETDMLRATPFEPTMKPEDVAAAVVYYGLDAPSALAGATIEMFG